VAGSSSSQTLWRYEESNESGGEQNLGAQWGGKDLPFFWGQRVRKGG